MRSWSRRAAAISATLLLLATTGCSASGDQGAGSTSTSSTTAAGEERPELTPVECPMSPPASVEVACSWLTVPADRDEPDGATIRLPVAQISGGPDAEGRTPVVVIEGGPGVGSLDRIDVYAQVAQANGRDVIIWDQRGTGFAEPSLSCDDLPIEPGTDVPPSPDPTISRCALGARQADIDLADYSTIESEADLEDLRLALGIDRWNLWANSYGTVVAQHALRTHPEGIASALLGAPVRVDAGIPDVDGATAGAASVAELDAACQTDGACAEHYGDLVALAERAVRAIDERSELDADGVRVLLMRALYASDALPRIPGILQTAADGDPTSALAQLSSIEGETIPSSALLQQAAMLCSDLGRLSPGEVLCEASEVEPGPASFNEPLDGSDVPVLVVFGRFDPIIERDDAQAVADDLGVELTTVEASHDAIRSSSCVQQVWSRWLDDPTVAPDDACLREPVAFD